MTPTETIPNAKIKFSGLSHLVGNTPLLGINLKYIGKKRTI
jgi:hypothetical protein